MQNYQLVVQTEPSSPDEAEEALLAAQALLAHLSAKQQKEGYFVTKAQKRA